jgi:hypothetical protein
MDEKKELIIPEEPGHPGLPNHMLVVPIFNNDSRIDEERIQDGELRSFKLQAQLSKYPMATQDLKGDFTKDDGGSFLIALEGAVMCKLEALGQRLEIHKNKNNELSFIEYECQANSFEDAKSAFYKFANPVFDFLSFSANCPIYIQQLRIEDKKNQITYFNHNNPYPNSTLNNSIFPSFAELRPVYALYREAKNTNSYFYRFLSYFKIMEGFRNKISKDIQIRLKNTAIDNGGRDLLPPISNIDALYQKYVGASIWKFYDEVLNPEFRIVIAHYAKENGDILNISDTIHQEKFVKILPIIELCVRVLVDKYNGLLNQLTQLGK